jgi:class 3 adenylate cyclase/tetratricopeptide (TPR) repeat protein
MTTERAATTTILFSDLVGSTELLQRAGDEDAQRLFKAHYQLLRDGVSQHGGAEVKSLGDGLMVAFPSAADAVRCAIAMQQMSRRPVNGEHLAIRVGLNAGDALRDEGDYFGTSVVTARRLCDRAGPGQILCSALVEGLLAGRQAFSFRDLGELELKGLTAPVASREVIYETEQQGLMLSRTPFVGRDGEMARLKAKLAEARTGRGGLAMLVGEPGIGKSRMIEEFTEGARADGAAVLFGACFEGEWSPPYAPFVEAIESYAKTAEPVQLRADLGYGAPPIARLVPALRDVLPDVPEPAPLQPDEERFRLLDAVSQFIIAVSERAPVVLVLDDLHWADRGTIAMLRHAARFITKHRTLILGAYRDVELDRQHPLADALGALRREVEYERIALKGLEESDIGALLTGITEQDVPDAFVHAISDETDGNPFFIREVLIHLTDEGKIFQQDGRWTSNLSIAEMGIPEGVRQVIGRRLSRLSENANKLLTAAAGFNGPFRVDVAGVVAGLEDSAALDAVDEALAAQLVRSSAGAESCEFTHALIRHTLYGELSPPRQVRMHRRIAEAIEGAHGDRALQHAAEIAYHYHRSATMPGAERGVDYAEAAAVQAEGAGAWDEAAAYLRMAQEMLADGAPRQAQVKARLAIALAHALAFDEAVAVANEAADELERSDGASAAADYLCEAARALSSGSGQTAAWSLATRGLRLVGDRRDATWAWLKAYDLMRAAAEDPEDPGIAVDTSGRRDVEQVLRLEPLTATERGELLLNGMLSVSSRAQVLKEFPDDPSLLTFWAGEYRRALPLWEQLAQSEERRGNVAWAVAYWSQLSRCQTALGNFEAARVARDHAATLSERLTRPSMQQIQLLAASAELGINSDGFADDGEQIGNTIGGLLRESPMELRWVGASLRAGASTGSASRGEVESALQLLASVVASLERAPGWAANYLLAASAAVNTLYVLNRADHADVLERNLREKVLTPDFRYASTDVRLLLGALCKLTKRYDEAIAWYAQARTVLDEQGARPLRATADLLEAELRAERSAPGDRERALALVDAFLAQGQAIGMTNFLPRADELRTSLTST